MFCDKCGAEIPENGVCPNCVVETESEVQEPVVTETPAENADFAQADFDTPKKKSLTKKLISLVAAILVVVLVVFNFGNIQNFYIRHFASAEDYFKYVEKNAFEGYINTATESYANYVDIDLKDIGCEMNIKTTLGKQIELFLGETLRDFNNISLDLDFNRKDRNVDIDASLKLADKEILHFKEQNDMVNNKVYGGALNLSDKYFGIDTLSPSFDLFGGSLMGVDSIASNGLVISFFSEETLNSLMKKYITIAIDQINTVEKTSETVTIDEISQDFTVLEFKLTEKLLADIGIAWLEEVKVDKDIKKAYQTYLDYLVNLNLLEKVGTKSLIKDFYAVIDEGIKDLEKQKASNKVLFTLKDYVNNSDEIVGRTLIVDKKEVFRYITATDDNEFETAVEIDKLYLSGKGEKSDNTIDGEYEIIVDGDSFLTVELDDYDTSAAEQGNLKGTFAIAPGKALLKEINASEMLTSFKIKVEADCKKEKANLLCDLMVMGNSLLSIEIDSKIGEPKDIVFPKEEDVMELEDWVKTLDLEKLTKTLEDAGLPKDLIQQAIKETF